MADLPVTLSQHLTSEQGFLPAEHAPGVAAIVGSLGRVAVVIARELTRAALRNLLGRAGGTNVSGDEVKKLDVWGHEATLAALRQSGACAALVSEEAEEPIEMPEGGRAPRPRRLLRSGRWLLESWMSMEPWGPSSPCDRATDDVRRVRPPSGAAPSRSRPAT